MKCSFRGEQRTIGKIKDRNSIFWKFNQNWRDEERRRKKIVKLIFFRWREISLSLDSRSPLKKKMISCVDDVYWKYGDRKSLENGPKGRIFLPPGDIIARLNNNNNISSSFSYLAFTRRFCSCSASSWFLRIFSEKRSSIYSPYNHIISSIYYRH